MAYPQQTGYAFRHGVRCLVTRAGAVLLDPPHSQKLADLAPAQLQALKTLNLGPATLAELSAEPDRAVVGGLIDQLIGGGWLAIAVRSDTAHHYSIAPFGPGTEPASPPPEHAVLSKFAVLHRDSTGLVLEHPLASCDMAIHDHRLLVVLGDPRALCPEVPEAVAAAFRADLHRFGFLVAAGSEDADTAEFTDVGWDAPDLWFHRRSTLGERIVTWDRFGPTKWAAGRFAQPPARRDTYPGEPVVLPRPDLAARRSDDAPLTAVVEDRVSTRTFDDTRPLTADQLGELLYRTARTRRTETVGPGEQLLSRPYPSAGGVYELELYPVVRTVVGVEPGMYHYDSFDHVLRPVAAADSPAVARLIKPAAATLVGGAEPQVLLVIAARPGRILWTYEQIGYALILKDVGALMQTLYLAGTAMGIGVCAQGFGDTAAFTAATGVDERQECSVGSVVVGSRR
ncbi:SagB family peptide dehydrogenase [Mycobacterium koreense]|uniref:SagB family peptide dehydrogenase n=1 Tax=Mycolicibacillus koreensis TaxID=1069220 RepID=UPI000D6A7303|nr:SagB family peptide dehydrogenase [Mycolicibacillus koreensis]MCV7249228.1 SagB family peptide dehydrogenase [Mycolicibacillus koreensis]BBY53138.1 hypothetical protein MKOR_03890 [Mycolicibacillus koreensis]